ncbi:Protein MDT-15 b [Aphelenchoides avenae]|nr:Protein MDT-15 b [Aphelenchus avenae]
MMLALGGFSMDRSPDALRTSVANMDWTSEAFRSYVVTRLEAELMRYRRLQTKTWNVDDAREIEAYVFSNSRCKDDYMRTVAKIVNAGLLSLLATRMGYLLLLFTLLVAFAKTTKADAHRPPWFNCFNWTDITPQSDGHKVVCANIFPQNDCLGTPLKVVANKRIPDVQSALTDNVDGNDTGAVASAFVHAGCRLSLWSGTNFTGKRSTYASSHMLQLNASDAQQSLTCECLTEEHQIANCLPVEYWKQLRECHNDRLFFWRTQTCSIQAETGISKYSGEPTAVNKTSAEAVISDVISFHNKINGWLGRPRISPSVSLSSNLAKDSLSVLPGEHFVVLQRHIGCRPYRLQTADVRIRIPGHSNQ